MKRSEFLERVAECHNVRKVDISDLWAFGLSERRDAHCRPVGRYILVINLATFGDYDGSTFVERANCKVLQEKGLPICYGAYGSVMTYIPHNLSEIKSEDFDEICEMIESLEDYPLLDDELHSQMEFEAYQEYWDDYGSREYWKHIRSMPYFEDIEGWDFFEESELFRELDGEGFSSALEHDYIRPESGGNVYLDHERLARLLCDDDIQAILGLWRSSQGA